MAEDNPPSPAGSDDEAPVVKSSDNKKRHAAKSSRVSTTAQISELAHQIIGKLESTISTVLDAQFKPEDFAADIKNKSNKSCVNDIARLTTLKANSLINVNNAKNTLLTSINQQIVPLTKSLAEFHKNNKSLYIYQQAQDVREQDVEAKKAKRVQASNARSISKAQQSEQDELDVNIITIDSIKEELKRKSDFYTPLATDSEAEKKLKKSNRKTREDDIAKLELRNQSIRERIELLNYGQDDAPINTTKLSKARLAEIDLTKADGYASSGSGYSTPATPVSARSNASSSSSSSSNRTSKSDKKKPSFLDFSKQDAIVRMEAALDAECADNKHSNSNVNELFDAVRERIGYEHGLVTHDKKVQLIPVDVSRLEATYEDIEASFEHKLSTDACVCARWRVEIAIVRGEKLYDPRRGPNREAIKKCYQDYLLLLKPADPVVLLAKQAEPVVLSPNDQNMYLLDGDNNADVRLAGVAALTLGNLKK